MEAELSSLGSKLERAKLAQVARARRLQADGKSFGTKTSSESKLPNAERIWFPDGSVNDCDHLGINPDLRSASLTDALDGIQWMLQLDLSHGETKVGDEISI